MYAVIRTGGKQYRVAPGDTLKVETDLAGAKVLASVVGEGRGAKILVFHLKRKKQYKKMQGHRQNFTEIKIDSIEVGGRSLTA
jgi:large subunit ribosomal protein L21